VVPSLAEGWSHAAGGTHLAVVPCHWRATLALMPSGCLPVRERICSKGEHVVRSIEAPKTGRTCVRDGERPPKGYDEYPPGEVPTYTDEDY
jgi:hypothetical protein